MDRGPSPNPAITTPVSTLTPVQSEQTVYASAHLGRAKATQLGNSPAQRAIPQMAGYPAQTEAAVYQQMFIESRRP
jgi:hypothetical protein